MSDPIKVWVVIGNWRTMATFLNEPDAHAFVAEYPNAAGANHSMSVDYVPMFDTVPDGGMFTAGYYDGPFRLPRVTLRAIEG